VFDGNERRRSAGWRRLTHWAAGTPVHRIYCTCCLSAHVSGVANLFYYSRWEK